MSDPRNCKLGDVEIKFRTPKDLVKSSVNTSRLPEIHGKTIYFPNDESIEVVKFAGTKECLVIGSDLYFGRNQLAVIWCGDRSGLPFMFGFTNFVKKIGKTGDYQKFLAHIKPQKTATIESYKDYGKPKLYDTVWITKLPKSWDETGGMSMILDMVFPSTKKFKGDQNTVGVKTVFKTTQVVSQHPIRVANSILARSAVVKDPVLNFGAYQQDKLFGHFLAEASRYQVQI